jgi:hypothetical protein
MNELKDIPYENNLKFASFDITNIYTNIPTRELSNIIKYLCIQNNVDLTIQTKLKQICNTFLSQNYFQFNNSYYLQGLGMRAPTSSIFSEIHLNFLENTIIYNILEHKIIGYFCYMDNILIVYKDSNTNIHKVQNLFNEVSPTIFFTIEEEENNSINFLDISNYKNNGISFKIYRKFTTTDLIIPYDLNQPPIRA